MSAMSVSSTQWSEFLRTKWSHESASDKRGETGRRAGPAFSISASAISCWSAAKFTTTIARANSVRDLHELSFQSSFALLTKSYSGTLSYRDGHLQLQNANPIAHNFNARFIATPDEFKLESADLSTANSRVSIVATVRDYSQPQVHATYEAAIDGGEFRRALKDSSLPEGIVRSTGALDYDSRSDPRFWRQSMPRATFAAQASS